MGKAYSDSDFENAEMVYGDGDFEDATNDAPTQPQARDYSLFRSEFASPQLPPGHGAGVPRAVERALLTNDPPQNMAETALRGVPAAIGGALGGSIGLVAGAPLTVGAAATSLGGAALGGGAFEAGRQGLAQAYSGLTGRGQVQQPGFVVRETLKQGALQVPGQALNIGTGLAARYAAARLPSTLKQFFGTPEELTQYAQRRGSDAVFTPQNLNEGAPLANIGEATADLAAGRRATGAAIGSAEDSILSAGAGKALDLGDIASDLRQTLTQRGYLDPRTQALARGQDVSLLRGALKTLESNGGKMDLRQLINTKRLIDSQLEFSGGINKAVSEPAEAIAKSLNGKIREKVRAELGEGVSKLYDDFGVIADAQEKLAEFTGTKALSKVEQLAAQRLRSVMLKNPAEVDNIVKVLGAGLPGGEAQARTIFDSIAAEAFTRGGIGAPSNALLKTATAGGLLSGPTARGMVRGTEALTELSQGPLIVPRAIGPASSALSDAYNRRREGR